MLAIYLSLVEGENEKTKFEKIYMNYRVLMLSRAYEILKDRQLAEDAAQNAFVRLLNNLDKVRDADSTKTKAYVMVILENVAKTMYIKRGKQKIFELDENIPDVSNVERETENKITAKAAAEKIAELPEKYRDVLVLRYFNDLSDKDIASTLGISQPAVRKRIQRARAKLITLMGGHYG